MSTDFLPLISTNVSQGLLFARATDDPKPCLHVYVLKRSAANSTEVLLCEPGQVEAYRYGMAPAKCLMRLVFEHTSQIYGFSICSVITPVIKIHVYTKHKPVMSQSTDNGRQG